MMNRLKITDTMIENAQPKDKPYALADSVVPGLLVIINPSGVKTFCLRLQSFRKKIAVYPYDKIRSARQKGIECHSEHLQEIRMKNQRKDPNLTLPVHKLVDEYLEFKKSSLSEKTWKEYVYTWNKCGRETLGDIFISELTDTHVNELFIQLKDTYSHTETLKIILLSAFKYGKQKGYPVAALDGDSWIRYKRPVKERYFTSGELSTFNRLVQERKNRSVSYGNLHQQMIALQLLLYTGCRCSEILELKWSDVFFKEGYVQLWKTKTRKGRLVPLSDRVCALLEEAQRYQGDTYVFTSVTDPDKPISYNTFQTVWYNLIKEGKFNQEGVERLRLHSLRHTFITAANRSGISPWTLKALVGHSNGSCVTGIYIHHNLQELTQAQATIIDALQKRQY
jgi:integrase